jgi:hypothetical protein
MKRRLKYCTPSEIQSHLSNQKKSGLPVEAYCSRAKVSVSTFWNWRKKFRTDSKPSSSFPFLHLPAMPAIDTSMVEIHFSNKTLLKVPSGFDEGSLRTLIALLR